MYWFQIYKGKLNLPIKKKKYCDISILSVKDSNENLFVDINNYYNGT